MHRCVCAHAPLCVCVCVCSPTSAWLERRKRTSRSSRQASAPFSLSAWGARGRGRSPESAVAVHGRDPGWVMDQLCACWGMGEMLITPWICAFHFLQGAAAKSNGEGEWLSAQEAGCSGFTAETSSVRLGRLSSLSVPQLSHL